MTAPTTSSALAELSPTRLERLLQCPLRIAFEQAGAGFGSRAARSPWALVGLAVHRAVELCLDDPPSELTDAWAASCDELAADGTDPRGAPNARRAFLRLERRLPELLAYVEDHQPAEKMREAFVRSRDGVIGGQVDLLLHGPRTAVVDHKTGAVLNDGEPRGAYERQLQIYAWVIEDSLGIDPQEGALFSLREGIVSVDVSREKRDQVIVEALEARDQYNGRAPGRQPGRPTQEACGRCPFVGPCDTAWGSLATGLVEGFGWGDAIRGTVTKPVVVAAGGAAAIVLNVQEGTVQGEGVLFDVPLESVANLAEGDRLAAWHLARRSDEPLVLAWRGGSSRLHIDR